MLLEGPPTRDVNWNPICEGDFSYHFRPRATIGSKAAKISAFKLVKHRVGPGCLNRSPRKLTEFLLGLLGCGAQRVWRDNEELSSGNERTRRPLIEFAREVADHASTAEYVFHTKDAAGAKAEG
jgi:hypothetical protein